MGKIYDNIKGVLRLELTGAYIEGLLNASALSAIEIWDIESVDAYTLLLSVYESDIQEFSALAEKAMCQLRIVKTSGGTENKKLLKRRSWLLGFTAVILLMLMVSSLFVWEIKIVGNEELSRGEIMRALGDCGLDVGSFRYSVSADLVRSKMVQLLPEIAWMTVNISGSRATAVILERQEKPEIYSESQAADIVAAKTGLIRRMSVQNGKAVMFRGESVLEGETVISAQMDSIANRSRYVRAKGHVLADTWQELSAICPLEEQAKEPGMLSRSRFALVLGKKRINLYFDSGKVIDECDKIIHDYKLGVEGLFALPVKLVREELRGYESHAETVVNREALEREMSGSLLCEVQGQVLSQSFTEARSGERYILTLRSHCLEDIARVKRIPA